MDNEREIAGVFDVVVPVMIGDNEECIKGGRMTEDELNKYLTKMNEHFETSFYEMYETIDNETQEDLEYFSKTNYEEYRKLMGKKENLWKRYHRAKSEEDKSKILTEINDIQSKIKEHHKMINIVKILLNVQNLYKIILIILIKICKKKKIVLGYYNLIVFLYFDYFIYFKLI